MDDDMADMIRNIWQVQEVEDNPKINKELKEVLIRRMHQLGFTWIVDVAFQDGQELIASKDWDTNSLFWRPLEEEKDVFKNIFRGSIERLA